MLHLALKAFRPELPLPVMHVDTGHNFDEVIQTRDELVAEHGVRLIVVKVKTISTPAGSSRPFPSRNPIQTVTLLRAIRENKFDAAFWRRPARRGKARAKERVFSFRDEFGQWDPKAQRPSCGTSTTSRHHKGEHIRVFPLSNWTEFDIWSYIGAEKIKLPSIYYAHAGFPSRRMLLAVHRYMQPRTDEEVFETTVRFRTVGDVTCTGCVESLAGTVSQVIAETAVSRLTERGATRADDQISEAGMEDRKRQGYFLMTTLLLRLATAGSVDDGKSTLIGRLLYDSKAVMEDQLASVKRTSKERGHDYTDLAEHDGLRAEREQGITIDVAYRYATPPRRKFIIADTPPHPVHPQHGHRHLRRNWRSCWSTPPRSCSSSRAGMRSWRRCWASSTLCSRSTRWT